MRGQLCCTGGAVRFTVGALCVDDAILCTEISLVQIHKLVKFFFIYMIIFQTKGIH